MSRSHLYRANNTVRPISAIILASLWAGGALCLLVARGGLGGGEPLVGAAAALVERASLVLAVSAVVVGLASLVRDVVIGRTPMRLARLVGAGLLIVAGGAGLVDTLRLVVRPGTPIATAAPPVPAAPTPAVPATEPTGSMWTVIGLLGSTLVVGGGVVALRARERQL